MIDALLTAAGALDPWEATAVVLAVAYLLFAVRQNVLCWPAALVSTTIFLFVFAGAKLYMESALQLFYMAMAVYGWHQWTRGGSRGTGVRVSVWPPRVHLKVLGAVVVASLLSGWWLAGWTDAELVYLDSFTTWASLVATFMVARKILENWLYWFVIDALNIYLYVSRELYLTALLFAAYLVIIVFGYVAWRRDLLRHESARAAA